MSRFPCAVCLTMCIPICGLTAASAPASDADPPPGPHQLALEAHRDTPTNPALIHGSPGRNLRVRAAAARPRATVFGYLPYWSEDTYLRYDLLTHLACFSVGVNEDGTLGNDHDWPWTATIEEAHQHGVKVILVATLFNADAITTLITNAANRERFFENIRDKMLEGDADGLNIDFESGTGWQSSINDFMADLTAYLHAEIPGCEVTFAGPAVNWSDRWDLAGLADACDGIFIMGYAFYGSWSTTTGPNAPLTATGGGISITDTVMNQYAAVRTTHPEKLILGVPYYGLHWTCESQEPRSPVVEWQDSPRFFDAQPQSETYGLQWEETSQTPWYYWNNGTQWHQVWFDNAESLALKYDLAMENGFQGVGMWALGYDDGRDELWDLLEDTFIEDVADADGDGVPDPDDLCPETPAGQEVDSNGCAASQRDADGDGVMDDADLCPDTPSDEEVDTNGCTVIPDDDRDGVLNEHDACPDTPEGHPVDADGCSRWQLDQDGDGVPDDEDQCADTPANVPVDSRGCASGQSADGEPDDTAPRSNSSRGGTCGIGMLPAVVFLLLAFSLLRIRRE